MNDQFDRIPELVPQLPRKVNWNRAIPLSSPFQWLSKGWKDFRVSAGTSLFYGLAVFLLSAFLLGAIYYSNYDFILLPALAGFMVAGPTLAIGLYNKSRILKENLSEVSFSSTLDGWSQNGGQILFVGVLLLLLMALWIRSAVLIYALFFGLVPFTGIESQLGLLFTTQEGLLLLIVGTSVGGLFAAFAFAISAFSIPMLLDEETDAFTAMGTSMALAWNNIPLMLVWGAIISLLFLFSILTALLGLILVFPLLGHATWHAYTAMRHE